MTFEEFKTLMEGAIERQNLEFKRAVSWNPANFVPSILAMSNLRDGGTIVVGVDNEPVILRGLSDEQVNSFKREQMMDQVATYGVPPAQFDVHSIFGPIGGEMLKFIVIRVKSFQISPVICSRDSFDKIKRGALYYRNSNGRPQSAIVSSENDMREIIEIAAMRQIQHWREIGLPDYSSSPTSQASRIAAYDAELGGKL